MRKSKVAGKVAMESGRKRGEGNEVLVNTFTLTRMYTRTQGKGNLRKSSLKSGCPL